MTVDLTGSDLIQIKNRAALGQHSITRGKVSATWRPEEKVCVDPALLSHVNYPLLGCFNDLTFMVLNVSAFYSLCTCMRVFKCPVMQLENFKT